MSPGDLEADGFLSQTTWTAAELARRLNEIPDGGAVQAEALPAEIQIAERDSSGYVTSLQICGNLYTGEEVQYALGLLSPCFSFEDLDGKIRVSCKGIGAGYGFSQAGANALEREGYDYKELLHYYFQDVEILDTKILFKKRQGSRKNMRGVYKNHRFGKTTTEVIKRERESKPAFQG